MRNCFRSYAALEGNEKWKEYNSRESPIYKKGNDIRSEFERDYNRILHCTAYRRLKHKTQVFFATENDHVCTRIEHVNHVNSISYTISKYLGLNTELTSAIAIGHDLGHPPFGHIGENVLKTIAEKELKDTFWHEKNSLHFIDNIETLPNPDRTIGNLNLTYAVRDGIVCHCGEIDENNIFPRSDKIQLDTIKKANEIQPFSWEGCVVKISDKIAYLGRDIEDALNLKLIRFKHLKELIYNVRAAIGDKAKISSLNNSELIHHFIVNLCENSTPEKGLYFSSYVYDLMKTVKDFNYKYIYKNPRLDSYVEYTDLIIRTIYKAIIEYAGPIRQKESPFVMLQNSFGEWIEKYALQKNRNSTNKKIYDISNIADYKRAAIDFISGMTDNFAIKIFKEINTF